MIILVIHSLTPTRDAGHLGTGPAAWAAGFGNSLSRRMAWLSTGWNRFLHHFYPLNPWCTWNMNTRLCSEVWNMIKSAYRGICYTHMCIYIYHICIYIWYTYIDIWIYIYIWYTYIDIWIYIYISYMYIYIWYTYIDIWIYIYMIYIYRYMNIYI